MAANNRTCLLLTCTNIQFPTDSHALHGQLCIASRPNELRARMHESASLSIQISISISSHWCVPFVCWELDFLIGRFSMQKDCCDFLQFLRSAPRFCHLNQPQKNEQQPCMKATGKTSADQPTPDRPWIGHPEARKRTKNGWWQAKDTTHVESV